MNGMQLQLFGDLPLPPRPSQYSDSVTNIVVDKILKSIFKWVHHEKYTPSQNEIDEVKSELFNAIQWDDDPYQIAKNLEYSGWEPDGELVDLLGNVSHYRYDAHADIVKHEWILKYGVEPKFSIGDKVSFKNKNGFEIGEVVDIYADAAKYAIYCEHRGHVRKGVGTRGNVIPFEDCSPVERAP